MTRAHAASEGLQKPQYASLDSGSLTQEWRKRQRIYCGSARKGKVFFFEKKKQKTSVCRLV
jgi:hypothetical protein